MSVSEGKYRAPTHSEIVELENLVDRLTNGLPEVLDMLAGICAGEAESAKALGLYRAKGAWDMAGVEISSVSDKLKREGL